MNTEILFIGFLMSDKKMDLIRKNEKHLMHFAANKFQWNIIKGLIENEEIASIEALTSTFLSCYPNYPQIFFGQELETKGKLKINYLPFLNLRILKSITISLSTLFYSLIWTIKNRKKNRVIVTYAMYPPFMLINFILKHIYSTKQIIVVLDLPEYMNLSVKKQPLLIRLFSKLNIKIAWKTIQSFNGYVLLTKHMSNKLNIKNKPFVVIEGFADEEAKQFNVNEKQKNENKMIIMYAGSLNERYGVKNLVEAFNYIPYENYELWLCGAGDCDAFIQQFSIKDSRIKFFGVVENQKVLEMEKMADMLINPRPTKEEFTKYSFPSKNMEFMSMGVPLITTKLPGMPSEYNDYVFFIEDETAKGISETIMKVGNLPKAYLNEFGEKAKSFLYEHKSYKKQCEKLFSLIRELI